MFMCYVQCIMAFKKLSDQVQELSNPQRSDTFVKAFRNAVCDGRIEAAYIQERFTLPKSFTTRGNDGTYSKDSRDMIFDATPEFEEWFQDMNKSLAVSRRGGKIKPTVENIEKGLVDFRALAEETRRKMAASYSKGQQLGASRAKKPTAKSSAKAAPRRAGRPKKS